MSQNTLPSLPHKIFTFLLSPGATPAYRARVPEASQLYRAHSRSHNPACFAPNRHPALDLLSINACANCAKRARPKTASAIARVCITPNSLSCRNAVLTASNIAATAGLCIRRWQMPLHLRLIFQSKSHSRIDRRIYCLTSSLDIFKLTIGVIDSASSDPAQNIFKALSDTANAVRVVSNLWHLPAA